MITTQIYSHDPEQQKVGIQNLCEFVEKGFFPPADFSAGEILKSKLFSPHTKVRRWAYKAIALLQCFEAREVLLFKIQNDESDTENRGWATYAAFSILDASELRTLINHNKIDFYGTQNQLASMLFSRTDVLSTKDTQLNLFDYANSAIVAKFACILHGYAVSQSNIFSSKYDDKFVIRDLQSHSDVDVSEYAIWAFHKSRNGSADDLLIKRDDIGRKTSNVRRWAYRLLFKNLTNVDVDLCSDFINYEIGQYDYGARHGLTIALTKTFVPELIDPLMNWFDREKNDLIRNTILRFFAENVSKAPALYFRLLDICQSSNVSEVDEQLIRVAASLHPRLNSRFLRNIRRNSGQESFPLAYMVTNVTNKFGNVQAGVLNTGTIAGSVNVHFVSTWQETPLNQLNATIKSYMDLIKSLDHRNDTPVLLAKETVDELTSSSKENWREKAVKSMTMLRGIASTPGLVVEFVDKTKELIDSISGLLS